MRTHLTLTDLILTVLLSRSLRTEKLLRDCRETAERLQRDCRETAERLQRDCRDTAEGLQRVCAEIVP